MRNLRCKSFLEDLGVNFAWRKIQENSCPCCFLMFFVVADRHIGAVLTSPMSYLSSTTTLRREGDEAWRGLRVSAIFCMVWWGMIHLVGLVSYQHFTVFLIGSGLPTGLWIFFGIYLIWQDFNPSYVRPEIWYGKSDLLEWWSTCHLKRVPGTLLHTDDTSYRLYSGKFEI